MTVVFGGSTALWLWRSKVKFNNELSADARDNVFADAVSTESAVRLAGHCVGEQAGFPWCGTGRYEVLTTRGKAHSSMFVRAFARGGVESLYPIRYLHDVYVVGPEQALNDMAEELGFHRTAVLMMELCGHYRGNPQVKVGMHGNENQRTTVEKLKRFAECNRCSLIFNTALRYVVDHARSPVETALYLIMTLPYKHGGYHFPPPDVNKVLRVPHSLHRSGDPWTIIPDFYWEKRGYVLEYDSDKYHFDVPDPAEEAKRDRRRSDVMVAMGLSVRHMTSEILKDYEVFDQTMNQMLDAVKAPKRPKPENYRALKIELRTRLLKECDPMSDMYL